MRLSMMRTCVTALLIKYHKSDKTEKKQQSGACVRCGRDKNVYRVFHGETWMKQPDADFGIILN